MRISMFSKISRILGSDLAAFREVSDSCRVSVTSYHCSVVCSHVPALLHGSCTGHVHANTQWYISAIVMIIIIIHEPIYTLLCANFDNNFSSIITESVLRAHLMTVQAVVGSIVWAFPRLKKQMSRGIWAAAATRFPAYMPATILFMLFETMRARAPSLSLFGSCVSYCSSANTKDIQLLLDDKHMIILNLS